MNGRWFAATAGLTAGGVLLAGVFMAAGRRSRAAERPAGPDSAIVNTLDRMCQEKFQTVDFKDFGMSRIARPEASHPGLRKFKPATDAERALMAEARDSGWDAVLYVAGRGALRLSPPTEQTAVLDAPGGMPATRLARINRRALTDAAILTGDSTRAPLPTSATLLPEAVRAFKAFQSQNTLHFQAGEWSVTARPIRAEKAECVACHRTDDSGAAPKVGDVLGVAMYAFAPAENR